MPELPEVETTRRLIEPDLVGRRVSGFEIGWSRTLGGVSEERLGELLLGKTCLVIDRRAKYLLAGFAAPRSRDISSWLVVHLRMTGRLVVEPASVSPSPHCRFSMVLGAKRGQPKARLDFIDPRKFGRCIATEDPTEVMPALGPEPLSEDFTAAGLFQELHARRRQLKPLLLDQSFLAGLGNIYVDETLFRARLHPLTSSERVSRPKALALHAAIQTVLAEAIEREGSSFDGFYRTPTGQPGSYQHQFQVYGRHGKPCRECDTGLRRIVVGQRGTHFCPRCQRR